MTKIIARVVCAAVLLGAIPGLALAANSNSRLVSVFGPAADISGGDMTHGCSPVTTPCK